MKIEAQKEFEAIYPKLKLAGSNFLQIVDQIEQAVRQKYGEEVTQGSINNCRGAWNELAFVMEAHRSILKSTQDLYIVKMGNESSIKFWEIYTQESRQRYQSLVNQLKQHNQPMVIRCSTPDFVVLSRDIISNSINSQIIQSQSPSLQEINQLYKVVKNNCNPDRVKGFISLKTSTRPDRRYQILLEANVTKFASKYIHSSSCPLRYDVIGKNTKQDIDVFTSPLMSTLPLISTIDVASVERVIDDEPCNITSRLELDDYWKRYK